MYGGGRVGVDNGLEAKGYAERSSSSGTESPMPLAAAPAPLAPDAPPPQNDRPTDTFLLPSAQPVERIRQDIAADFYDDPETLDQQLDACPDAILADAL